MGELLVISCGRSCFVYPVFRPLLSGLVKHRNKHAGTFGGPPENILENEKKTSLKMKRKHVTDRQGGLWNLLG
jgi:hypothetical protein